MPRNTTTASREVRDRGENLDESGQILHEQLACESGLSGLLVAS